jgi:hypothetical protein
MDQVRRDYRAGGFIDCSSDSDGEVAAMQIEELTDGHTCRMAHGHSSRLTTLEGGFQNLQGALKNIDEALGLRMHTWWRRTTTRFRHQAR